MKVELESMELMNDEQLSVMLPLKPTSNGLGKGLALVVVAAVLLDVVVGVRLDEDVPVDEAEPFSPSRR